MCLVSGPACLWFVSGLFTFLEELRLDVFKTFRKDDLKFSHLDFIVVNLTLLLQTVLIGKAREN